MSEVYHTGVESGCDAAAKELEGVPRNVAARGSYMYAHPMPRANALIIREHLQEALRAGLNSEALRHVVAAIKEIERD